MALHDRIAQLRHERIANSEVAALTADIDIYRGAKIYIGQHGDQAALQAAMQTDELLATGDMDGSAVWRKIIKAVEVLQSTEPGRSTD